MNERLVWYVVQSSQVRGERRSYWIEKRDPKRPRTGRHEECIADFGTNKRRAEKRCTELNAELSRQAPSSSSEGGR